MVLLPLILSKGSPLPEIHYFIISKIFAFILAETTKEYANVAIGKIIPNQGAHSTTTNVCFLLICNPFQELLKELSFC